jgi:hypothetical protein
MTWRRAALYWVILLGLYAYDHAAGRDTPASETPPVRAAFLGIAADRIDAFEVRRATSVVQCRRVDGRWKVIEPADRAAPADLIEALVASVTELPEVEVVADSSARLADFGLQEPQSEMTLRGAGHTLARVRLGAQNPAGTAVYAQRDDSPMVVLVGLNVRYYENLLFSEVGPPQPHQQ